MRYLRALVSRPVLVALAIAGTLLLAGEWRAWLERVEASDARPATPTKAMRRWPLVPVEAVVQAPAIPPAELPGVRRRWNRPDLVAPRPQDGPGRPGEVGRLLLPVSPAPPASGQPDDLVVEFPGQIQREGAILLAEAEDKRPAPAGVRVAAFLETDGRTTLAVDPRELNLIGFPLRWRAWGQVELSSNPDFEAGLAFRALRVGRLELAPAVAAGRRDGASEVTVRAVAWFDF